MADAKGAVLSTRSRRGTQREYEATLILRPDANKAAIKELAERLQGVISAEGGRLLKIDNWGVRTLAYPIKGAKQGIYLYLRFLGGSALVTELERNLKLAQRVVRYLTVRVDEDVDPGARPDEINAESIEEATETAPDPVEEAKKRAAEEAAARAAEEAAARAAEEAAAAAAAAAAASEDAGGEAAPEAEGSDEG